MLQLVIAIALTSSISSFSDITKWKDGNGVEWSPLSIKSNYYRSYQRCRALGMHLPSSADILDAIEFGLFDPSKNPAFAQEITGYDWMWVRDMGILGAHGIVSKQGDTSIDEGNERHYGVCASKH